MKNSWWQLLVGQQADGPQLGTSSTATSLLLGQAKTPLPAQFLDAPGAKLRFRAAGRMSTKSATPGTFTFDIRFGGIVVWNGGATPTLQVSQSNVSWVLTGTLDCRLVGDGTIAKMFGIATLVSAAVAGAICLPTSAPAVGTGFDSTASQSPVDLFGTFSVNDATNLITCHQFDLTSLN